MFESRVLEFLNIVYTWACENNDRCVCFLYMQADVCLVFASGSSQQEHFEAVSMQRIGLLGAMPRSVCHLLRGANALEA